MFSLDLLGQPQTSTASVDSISAWGKQEVLIKTLKDFKVSATPDAISVGPTVTRIEFQLGKGILVSKVTRLLDNIAMALSVPSVNFVPHVAGKTTIAIEIPNESPEVVTLRECLENTDFTNSNSKLTFALGKDISGSFHYADLKKMPHLLVGGSTNSGKSAFLNSLITSILYRATPNEVQFVMIDPKRVELSFYKDIPHLMTPVITDVSEAANALKNLIIEMDRRFDLFVQESTRNIENYNAMQDDAHKLPYIVLVIDELAELMQAKGKEVEPAICRLTQLARATGIHLVIATQRPSVDVITGLIKSNVGSRISFSVAQAGDSRTILGQNGAEKLIGKGDMLYMPIGDSQPCRIQGCYISEDETHAVVEAIKVKKQSVKSAVSEWLTDPLAIFKKTENDEVDDIMPEAIRWSVKQGGFSVQNIQMQFRCNFNIARKIIETFKVFCLVNFTNGMYHVKLNEHSAEEFLQKHYNK